MLTGMDTGSILNRAIDIVNEIWIPTTRLNLRNCLRVNLTLCNGEFIFPAQFYGSTLFVVDCSRVDIHQRK